MTKQTLTRAPAAETSKKPRSTSGSPGMDRRRFKRIFFAEIQAQLREALGLTEDDTLPDVFRVPFAVPLKIGIAPDLQNRYGLRDPKHPRYKLLTKVLKRYCQSTQYHYAILNAKTRFNMNLKPAQPITDEDRQNARIKLEWYRKTREKTQATKLRETAQANPEPPPDPA